MADGGMRLVRSGEHGGRIAEGGGRPETTGGASEPVPAAPWRAGIATGVGSMPGTDPVDAAAVVAGELPDLPHLVELPQRGAGADMIGRTAAMLVDMPVEVMPSGWRLTRRPGRDLRRAIDFLAWDLDAAEQHFAGAPWIKTQVAGPWTLAAQLETPSGNRSVLDPGAVADLAASLAEGLSDHLAALARRLPGTRIAVQVDEPLLPAVLAGTLSTASGFGTVPAVDETRALEVLSTVTGGVDAWHTIAHCCHPDIPVRLLRRAGFATLSLDLTDIGSAAARLDPLGEAVEDGAGLMAGLVPTAEPARSGAATGADGPAGGPGDAGHDGAGRYDFHAAAAPLLELWHRLGLPDRRLAQVAVTPTCGLAAASPGWARRALGLARDAARLLAERVEGS